MWSAHVEYMRILYVRTSRLRRILLGSGASWAREVEEAVDRGSLKNIEGQRPAWLVSVEEPCLESSTYEARLAAFFGVPESAV
jgi:hypothetical protein